jgi:hypothetical protein
MPLRSSEARFYARACHCDLSLRVSGLPCGVIALVAASHDQPGIQAMEGINEERVLVLRTKS